LTKSTTSLAWSSLSAMAGGGADEQSCRRQHTRRGPQRVLLHTEISFLLSVGRLTSGYVRPGLDHYSDVDHVRNDVPHTITFPRNLRNADDCNIRQAIAIAARTALPGGRYGAGR